jgi:Yip1 domain
LDYAVKQMDAQSHLPIYSDNVEGSTSPTGISFAWIDIAYGILFSPGKTLEILGNSAVYKTGKRAFIECFIAFLLSALVSNIAKAALEFDCQSVAAFVIIATLMNLFTWLSLAMFLQFLGSLFNRSVNWLSTFIVTGWAFLPLIFTAPIACFVLASSVCSILLLIPLFWFSYLQLLAFASLLKLGKVKTVSLLMVMPPIIFFASLFWFATFLFLFLGIFVSSIG